MKSTFKSSTCFHALLIVFVTTQTRILTYPPWDTFDIMIIDIGIGIINNDNQ